MNFKQHRIAGFIILLLAGLSIVGIQSCRKSVDYIHGEVTPYDNSKKVQASIVGIVKDESGAVIANAQVTTGAYSTQTDAQGFFSFTNVSIPEHATTIKVRKTGYFNGSRAIGIQAGARHEARIVLMAKGSPELFVSSNGGTVNFAGGLSITFPANGIKNAATGQAYSGPVYVYAKKIDPTTTVGRESMPGDLRGLTAANGEERLLQSFGMMVAELYDANGNALQMNNANAIMQLKVPTSLVANAPASIPLWYYDEAKEMWVEEGSATLQGDTYVGNVAHFSFWNCDTPAAAIFLEMNVQDQNGNPLQSVIVSLTNTANNDNRGGVTNSAGWVGGLVYPNATLDLAIYSNGNICSSSTPLYTQTITTSSVNQNLGIITVNVASPAAATIDGDVIDCLGQPLANSIVVIQPFGLVVYPNINGHFSYTIPCTPTVPVTFYSYDLGSNVYGTATATLVSGTNNVGSLNACGQVSEFLSISLTNTFTNVTASKTFISPLADINITLNPQTGQNVNIWASDSTLSQSSFVNMTGSDTTVGTFPISGVGISGIGSFTDTWYNISSPCTVTYSAFPLAPGDVIGTYNFTVVGVPSGNTYTATGSFRVNRP